MSLASYVRKDYVIRIVYYKTNVGGKVSFNKHVCYEETDKKAEQSARKNSVWAFHPSFFILGVRTIAR